MARKAPGRRASQRPNTGGDKSSEITQSAPEAISTNLDPKLQEAILQEREGGKLDASFSTTLDNGVVVVDVMAKLKDPDVSVPGLKISRTIGQVVTGHVAVSDIEEVRTHKNVLSLKRATRLHKSLVFSVPEINATPGKLKAAVPASASAPTGKGVIVGVVDYDCDFLHKNFRKADGSTRLLFLWEQNGGQNVQSPAGFGYGREFSSDDINAALGTSNPYQALQYDPAAKSHGTHVMDTAAGNGAATRNAGVAPEADLIFVNIAHDDIDVDELTDLADGETINFGNSKMLLEAVDYIFEKARVRGQKAVVNISLGTHGGPHDGSTLAEQGFDTLLGQPDRAIVIAAGNSHQHAGHASGRVSSGSPRVLQWLIPDADVTDNEVEIWYPGGAGLSVALSPPGGAELAPVQVGTTVTLSSPSGPLGRIVHRSSDPNNGANQIDIILSKQLKGAWKISLRTDTSTAVPFHAWIERDDFASGIQSRFAGADVDVTHTIGSVSCGAKTIAVGSYATNGATISSFSSEGPTRDNKQKPEVSAPGQQMAGSGILAARSKSQSAVRMSGTSMASPHVAGVIALMMEAADGPLAIDVIRTALQESARGVAGWDPRLGFGRVDAAAAVSRVAPAVVAARAVQVAAVAAARNGEPPQGDVPLAIFIEALANAARRSGVAVRLSLELSPERPS